MCQLNTTVQQLLADKNNLYQTMLDAQHKHDDQYQDMKKALEQSETIVEEFQADSNALSEQLAGVHDERDGLRAEVHALAQRAKAADGGLTTCQEEASKQVQSLAADLEQTRAAKAAVEVDLQGVRSSLCKALDDANARARAAEDEAASALRERDVTTSKLDHAVLSHEERLKQLHVTHQQQLKDATRAHDTDKAHGSAEVRKLRETLGAAEAKAAASQYKLQEVEHALAKKTFDLEASEACVTSLGRDVTTLRGETAKLLGDTSGATVALANRDAKIERLEAELATARTCAAGMKESHAVAARVADNERASLQDQLSGSVRLRENSERALASATAQMEKQALHSDQEARKLKAGLSSLEIALSDAKMSAGRAADEAGVQLSAVRSQLQKATIENEQAVFALTARHEGLAERLTEDAAHLRAAVAQMAADKDQTEAELKAAHALAADLAEDECCDLRNQLAQLQDSSAKAAREAKALQEDEALRSGREAASLKAAVAGLEAAGAEAEARSSRAAEEAGAQITALQQGVDHLTAKHEGLVRTAAEQKAAAAALEASAAAAEARAERASEEARAAITALQSRLAENEETLAALTCQHDGALQSAAEDTARLRASMALVTSDLDNRGAEFDRMASELRLAKASGTRQTMLEIKALYIRESAERKRLHNLLRELQGNIRVFCRVRVDARTVEDAAGDVMALPDVEHSECPVQIRCPAPGFERHSKGWEFDRVFGPAATQESVFKETQPLITSCADGYNVAIITYGQTGAGKTYTLMGTPDDPGLNPRAVEELLRICASREQVEWRVSVSLLEIYCDHLVDLLSDLPLHEQTCCVQGGALSGLASKQVASAQDVARILAQGAANRKVAATAMNSQSSRSHMLLVVTVHGTDKISGESRTGKLTLVDLAGSERVAKTFNKDVINPEQRLREANSINLSLTSLSQVFASLYAP